MVIQGRSDLGKQIERRLELPKSIPSGLDEFTQKFTRLAALGLISGYIMHEIRNALAVVSGNAQIIQIKGEKLSSQDIARRLNQILEQIDRTLNILNRIGGFTARAQGEIVAVQPDQTVANAISALERMFENRGLKVTESLMENEKTILCDASLFDFLLLQLLEACIPEEISVGKIEVTSSSKAKKWEMKLILRPEENEENFISSFIDRVSGFGLTAVLMALKAVKGELFLLSGPDDYGFRLIVPLEAD